MWKIWTKSTKSNGLLKKGMDEKIYTSIEERDRARALKMRLGIKILP